ncbi:uncharacterized protein LOC115775043 [Archocentrus centrarchus]|uniref:uncharacterized protein LOC115775043 n=1 Tax=Archocentrus centrarchus TaxID=63155 RepID=UPI0011E9B4F9|nr:uncharacterized protein LOC115775043 [Archocentrus centrarchus]
MLDKQHTEPRYVVDMDLIVKMRQEYECAELDSMLEGVINNLFVLSPPPPPCFPAEPPASPQPAADSPPAFVQHTLQMTAPPTTESAQLYSQPGTVSQGQCNNTLQIPVSMLQYLSPVRVMNGVFVEDFTSTAAPLNTPTPKKRKHQDEQEERQPYIEKSPNDLMLLLKEQRPKENTNGCAAANAVVGERGKKRKRSHGSTCSTESTQHKISLASLAYSPSSPSVACELEFCKPTAIDLLSLMRPTDPSSVYVPL